MATHYFVPQSQQLSWKSAKTRSKSGFRWGRTTDSYRTRNNISDSPDISFNKEVATPCLALLPSSHQHAFRAALHHLQNSFVLLSGADRKVAGWRRSPSLVPSGWQSGSAGSTK